MALFSERDGGQEARKCLTQKKEARKRHLLWMPSFRESLVSISLKDLFLFER